MQESLASPQEVPTKEKAAEELPQSTVRTVTQKVLYADRASRQGKRFGRLRKRLKGHGLGNGGATKGAGGRRSSARVGDREASPGLEPRAVRLLE